MREIKFRVWDKDLKTMRVCGEDVHDSINFDEKNRAYYYNLQNGCGGYPEGPENEDNEYIVMQYTGLKDRSGKEIYEGDIVRYLDGADCSSESGYDFDEFMNVGVIAWDKQSARYVVSNRNLVDLETFFEEIGESEVIGDIYENPELLGGTGA